MVDEGHDFTSWQLISFILDAIVVLVDEVVNAALTVPSTSIVVCSVVVVAVIVRHLFHGNLYPLVVAARILAAAGVIAAL